MSCPDGKLNSSLNNRTDAPGQPKQRRRRKYHHYRPALHLRHFADHRGRVWVYDRHGAFAPVQQRVTELGGESYLYAPDVGPDPRDDSMEVWLSDRVDNAAADAIRKTIRNESLSRIERSGLSAFVAAQDVRTPKAKEVILRLFQAGMDQEYAALTSDIARLRQKIRDASGIDYTDEELCYHVASHAVMVEKPSWLEFIARNTNAVGERIYHMSWHLVLAPEGCEFLTNDVGIVKFVGGFSRPASYAMGFSAGREWWLMPLSDTCALALAPRDATAPRGLGAEWVGRVNRQLTEDAHRFVYSRSFHDDIGPRSLESPAAAERHAELDEH